MGVELVWEFSEETARILLDFLLFERTCCKEFTYEFGCATAQLNHSADVGIRRAGGSTPGTLLLNLGIGLARFSRHLPRCG
jgi:hypothetical protein